MGRCILVTGGARSGKSAFSERLASTYGSKILYIATAVAFDKEMKDRIKKHKENRPNTWETVEIFKGIDRVIQNSANSYSCILLDCITIMLTNQLLDYFDNNLDLLNIEDYNKAEAYLMDGINKILKSIRQISEDVILVTNELGWGIVPENLTSRAFRDICGRVNQNISAHADEVYLTVCGIPLKIKG